MPAQPAASENRAASRQRPALVGVRLTNEEMRSLRSAAESKGQSVGAFIRSAIAPAISRA